MQTPARQITKRQSTTFSTNFGRNIKKQIVSAKSNENDKNKDQIRKTSGQVVPAVFQDVLERFYNFIVPNDPNNPLINDRLYKYYAQLKGLDISKLDKNQPKTKYEYNVTLDDGKGALPFDFIMNPDKWVPLR